MPKGQYQRFKKSDVVTNAEVKSYANLHELSAHVLELLTIRNYLFPPDVPLTQTFKEMGKNLEIQLRKAIDEMETEFNKIHGLVKPDENKNILSFNSVSSIT